MNTNRSLLFIFLTFALLLLSGCADKVSFATAAVTTPVGFWYGLWHGLTVPFSFFGMLFTSDIAVYAIYNNGGWYDFGFMLGIAALVGDTVSRNNRSS